MVTLKLDLHVHTVRSSDAHTRLEDLPRIIVSKRLDGVAITDHDVYGSAEAEGVLILPGMEISTRDGHVIALGLKESINAGLSADETIKRIRGQEGVSIIPHPHDPVSSRVKIADLKVRPDAVESINADALSFRICNWLSRRDALRFGLPQVAGSDSHIPETIGDAYTIVDSRSRDHRDILDAIRTGMVKPDGRPTSIRNKLKKLSYRFKRSTQA